MGPSSIRSIGSSFLRGEVSHEPPRPKLNPRGPPHDLRAVALAPPMNSSPLANHPTTMRLLEQDGGLPFHAPPASDSAEPARLSPRSRRTLWILSLLALLAGLVLRIVPSAGFTGVGFDEALYRDYVLKLDRAGIANYPEICELFLQDQRDPKAITKLPPTRFLFIGTAWMWKRVEFGDAPPAKPGTPGFANSDPALVSLHRVACLFTCLWLIVGGVAVWRMFGLRALPAALALMACSPIAIHFAQHALIDGVMAFWATTCLWLLWENLRRPNHTGWLVALGVSLGAMVLTKENAFFVQVALAGLVVANRWAKFGTVTPKLLLVGVLAPLSGVIALIALSGGSHVFVEIYQLLVTKAQGLTYAIKTGDGPWYRYIVDMVIVNPIVVLLAIGGIFTLLHRGRIAPANAPVSEAESQRRAFLYLLAFVGFSYLVMCNIRYGMNLRYASIWELPVCALAAGQLSLLSRRFGSKHGLVLAVGVAAIFFYDLRQYQIFFTDFGLYELVTEGLVRAVKILK
jgi:Dolichyl-phosphate-mannose-protein mannosyltransferase